MAGAADSLHNGSSAGWAGGGGLRTRNRAPIEGAIDVVGCQAI